VIIATTVEVGANVLTLGLAGITLLTLVVNNAKTTRAADAAESAAAQLQNNGGHSALDKIESGQREILGRLDTVDAQLSRHEEQLDELTARPPE